MSARDRILARIRDGLAGAAAPPLPAPIGRCDLGAGELVARFGERLQAVGGRIATAATAADVAALVAAELRAAGTDRVALGAGDAVAALGRDLADRGVHCLSPAAGADAAFAAGAGITAAQFGIAETGSVVLLADAGPARVASLVPPLHIALLPRTRMLADLDALFAALAPNLPHAVTLVTGPSRTADIELQLVIGVHGPRDLLVILV